MADPKPISITQVSEGDYSGNEPQPFVVVGDVPGGGPAPDIDTLLASVPGYDAGEVQTLTNTNGTFEWVTNE